VTVGLYEGNHPYSDEADSCPTLIELNKPENKQLIIDLNVKAYFDEVRLRAKSYRNDWGTLKSDKEASATVFRQPTRVES